MASTAVFCAAPPGLVIIMNSDGPDQSSFSQTTAFLYGKWVWLKYFIPPSMCFLLSLECSLQTADKRIFVPFVNIMQLPVSILLECPLHCQHTWGGVWQCAKSRMEAEFVFRSGSSLGRVLWVRLGRGWWVAAPALTPGMAVIRGTGTLAPAINKINPQILRTN